MAPSFRREADERLHDGDRAIRPFFRPSYRFCGRPPFAMLTCSAPTALSSIWIVV